MVKTLTKHGNSMALVVDKALMEQLGIDAGTPLQLTVSDGRLIVAPTNIGVGRARVEESVQKMRRRYGKMLKRLAS